MSVVVPGYSGFCGLNGEQPTPQWLCASLRNKFGTDAEALGVRFLARYRYTPEYSDFACTTTDGTDDDTLAVVGPGLEIKVQSVWAPKPIHHGAYCATGRLFIKEHGGNERLPVFYDHFANMYFPDSKMIPTKFAPDRDTAGASGAIITFEVVKTRTKYGSRWISGV